MLARIINNVTPLHVYMCIHTCTYIDGIPIKAVLGAPFLDLLSPKLLF